MIAGASFRSIVSVLGTEGRRRLVGLTLLTLVSAMAEFGILAMLLRLLQLWLGDGAGASRAAFLGFAAAVLLAGALRLALLRSTQALAFDTGHRLIVAVHRRVLARHWTTHVAARSSGPLAAVELVEQWLFGCLLPSLQGLSSLILGAGLLAAMLWVDAPSALLAAVVFGLLFLLVNLALRSRLRRAGALLTGGYEERIAAIQRHTGGLRELILAGARGQAAEEFRIIDRRLAMASMRIGVLGGMPRILVESIGLVALAMVAAWVVGRPGGPVAALPSLAVLVLGAQRLLPLFQSVSQAAGAMHAMQPLQEKLATMLAEPDLLESEPGPALPFTHSIALKALTYSYPERDERVLDEIDLVIGRGERIALTGPNGSGKSTLADILMGLLVPTSGEMLIDGRPLAAADLPAWQRSIAHVPQAPYLIDASIAANIAFMAGRVDQERVAEAVALAGLDGLVAALPDGLDTRIGERGQLLSGGQRQRLALARALYGEAPLLVLDEATSALDPESEKAALTVLDTLQARGVTIVLIAHRLEMLEGCDRVFRIEEGRLRQL